MCKKPEYEYNKEMNVREKDMMSRLIIEETSVYELDEECMRRKTAERMREKKDSEPCTKELKKAKQGVQDGQTLT